MRVGFQRMGFCQRPVKSRFPHSVEMDFFSFCSISSPTPEPMDSATPIPTTVPLPMTASPMPPIICTVPSLISESISTSPAPLDDAKIEEEKRYTLPKRYMEINRQMITDINRLSDGNAVDAIEELKQPRVFKRGTRGSKLSFSANIVTLDTRDEYKADALLDSGCEGSCIDVKYVQRLGLNTTKLPRPIPVFNADGQPNSDGPISEMISLELKIGEHLEKIDFGVTNLGRGEIFLGHDWLKLHNPSIDWRESLIEFNRCPSYCRPHIHLRQTEFEPEDEDEDMPWTLDVVQDLED